MILITGILAISAMGFANQRGDVCTVAAMHEIIETGRYRRIAALVEASAWIAGALVALSMMIGLPPLPGGYAFGTATVLGGVVFGLGAVVNRACIFGSVARLGCGEWVFAAAPIGLFLGALLGARVSGPVSIASEAPLLEMPSGGAVAVGAAAAVGLALYGWRAAQPAGLRPAVLWSAHAATIVMGLTSLGGLLTAGAWTYSELLTELAQGRADRVGTKIALNSALVAGAFLGGWSSGRFRSRVPELPTLARTLLGGFIMGIGASLIPGGNAGLVLAGIPLLWPYALLAFATICLTIYVALRFSPRNGQTAPIGRRAVTQQATGPDLKVALQRPAAGYAAHARALVKVCARPGHRAVRVQER